jgi:crossover junction endodeoxyribonuclease RuvC
MLTLGIDPGTATTGYGLVEEINNKLNLVEYGCIRTLAGRKASDRLATISEELSAIIKKFCPDDVAVEKLFFTTNAKTALNVGEARGVILLTAAQAGFQVAEYTPLQVKSALTGYGKAEKHQIQYMVMKLLCLKETPKPDDAADALAIAICHINSRKFKDKTK